ncbi:hypothetical protein GCM10023350_38080 [Nocardioides endophyticus]|uniref:Glycosyl transferase family 1 domain-containing protein n=1 Tax=Nocardioides endophyticus TaxID=1353775 RepID=A0ABP8Z8C0_9ACTN
MSSAGTPAPGTDGGGVPERRSSPGGNVVTGSLAAVGFHQPASVALVETVRPRRQPLDVVLSQNAWNFLSRSEFAALARDYDPRRRTLYRARRTVARVNTRRARSNVVLSHYMADLLTARGLSPVVSPVTLPLELCATGPAPIRAPAGIDGPFVVVPGTLTPYKRADYALDLLRLLPPSERPLLVLAGTDDGSGQQQRLSSILETAQVRHWIGSVDRDEMSWLLAHAVATLVPSRLESLSFSVAEALVLSPRVMASPLSVHREVAERLGLDPQWLPPEPDIETARALLDPVAAAPTVDRAGYRQEWHDLAALIAERSDQK